MFCFGNSPFFRKNDSVVKLGQKRGNSSYVSSRNGCFLSVIFGGKTVNPVNIFCEVHGVQKLLGRRHDYVRLYPPPLLAGPPSPQLSSPPLPCLCVLMAKKKEDDTKGILYVQYSMMFAKCKFYKQVLAQLLLHVHCTVLHIVQCTRTN